MDMPDSSSEAQARISVDDLLRQAGWDLQDRSKVGVEVPVKVEAAHLHIADDSTTVALPPPGDGLAVPLSRRADYVLYGQNGHPLAIIEAKRNAIQPYAAKQQALPYARALEAPFIFLTNGELIYFWDYHHEDARPVNGFYSQRDLERLVFLRKERKALATVPIPPHYFRSGEAREVRPYQQEAMRALDHAFELGKRRFLIELPTGTGKTDLISLYLKRLFEAGRAERVLFLVDREQLAKQALDTCNDLLGKFGAYWLKAGGVRQEKQITIALLQTMIGRVEDYSSGYYDVVVMDECHRSIYGSWQMALNHFDAIHIGLTATPASYIDRNTYRFYQCRDNKPDFSYTIKEAFDADYLVRYKFAKGITELIAEGTTIDDEKYDPEAFERKWTNEDSNRKMMAEFDKLAWQTYLDQAPGQKIGPGKSIVFAITKHHAARLCSYLNELHPEHKGKYAQVITSDVADADDLIRRFKKEAYPQIAVTVGMLDTGFDCREILHLVLCRRIRSPILYQQIRGRGTRTAPHIGKNHFVIYDFFRNHHYFNDSETNVFAGGGYGGGSRPTHPPGSQKLIELGLQDEWLESVTYLEIGPEGERIDKAEYVTHWQEAVRRAVTEDPILDKIRRNEPLTDDEETELAAKLNQPKHFFNEDNLRLAYKRPGGTLIDFVKEALGLIKVKSKGEQQLELFQAWLITKRLNPQQASYLHLLKNRGLAKGKVEVNDLFVPPLSHLNAASQGLELFGEHGLRDIIQDMNESVFEAA